MNSAISNKTFYRIACFLLCLLLVLSALGCSSESLISVSWFDADGVLIETKEISVGENPTERTLPADTDTWHYTGWTVTTSGNITVCTATRVSKTSIEWRDFDGTSLKKSFFLTGEAEPTFDLPTSNTQWHYTQWKKEITENGIVYTAQKEPNSSYFCGNVFQIIVKDEDGVAVSAGSGFVINEDGWFITNDHVMEGGYSASAFFDIPDSEAGTKYTNLNILGGVYHDQTKDIFIGKLENYQKIISHYNAITFTENYENGEECYSVGYPNSSVELQINSGTVIEEYSDIHDKINGIYYILSNAYIAPGSSGGILVNSSFEVIGITSLGLYADSNKQNFISGGSIPTFIFKAQLSNLSDTNLKALPILYGL